MNNWTVTQCGHSLSYQSVIVCPGGPACGSDVCGDAVRSRLRRRLHTAASHDGNDNIRIDCAPVETLFNGPADPLTCAASAPGAVPVITCTTIAVAPYNVPTAVAAPCMGGTDPVTFVVTTCSHDPAHNFPPVASIPCVDGPASTDPVTHITSKCTVSDVTDFIKTGGLP